MGPGRGTRASPRGGASVQAGWGGRGGGPDLLDVAPSEDSVPAVRPYELGQDENPDKQEEHAEQEEQEEQEDPE